jgi:tRNA-intron endonuclease
MKPTSGELKDTYVSITETTDVGKLYGKSRFGITQAGNTLKLHFIEALFLLEEQKLRIFRNKQEISFDDLLSYAASYDDSFETNYLVFQDLRRRGLQVDIEKTNAQFTFYYTQVTQKKRDMFKTSIAAFSERDSASFLQLKNLLDNTNGSYWIALADEEGDITYYTVELYSPAGKIVQENHPKTTGLLLSNRIILFDPIISEHLHQNEFFGKPFAQGLQLSLVEAAYLASQKLLSATNVKGVSLKGKHLLQVMTEQQPDLVFRSTVYNDLKRRGLIVKTGLKFGTHFRAYTQSPNRTHAEYLIHAVKESDTLFWPELSRAIRLCHAVNKKILFALVQNDGNTITYICINRLRP